MTIKQCLKKYGWQVDCDMSTGYRSMDVDVDFEVDGVMHETQFTINDYDEEALDDLFTEFCKENGFARNTVCSITIVAVYEELV